MVFPGKGMNLEASAKSIILGFVLVSLLAVLLPTLVTALIDMTVSLFNGTVFAPIFGADGLVIYGLLSIGVITFLFNIFKSK